MLTANVAADRLLDIDGRAFRRAIRERCLVKVHKRAGAGTLDYDFAVLFDPFDRGAGPDTELVANVSRNGDLVLSRNLGSYIHSDLGITTVMHQNQYAHASNTGRTSPFHSVR
jgi:hypothetical protein